MNQPTIAAPPMAEWAAKNLADARERTLLLLSPLREEELRTQYNALMGPILWDLGHIAHFEELWLLRNLEGPVEFGEMPGIFNPFENPRRVRGELQLPSLAEVRELLAEVRSRVLERLPRYDFASDDPLLRDGFVFRMVTQHEEQHGETILQALQLKDGDYRPSFGWKVPEASFRPTGSVRFPGGEVAIGTDDRSAAYDNERPRHRVRLEPFRIDVAPVTNGEYLEFMEAGGYDDDALWSPPGREWRAEEQATAPLFWERRDGAWWRRRVDGETVVEPDHPVCHVSCHEAEAFARWRGGRLPTEAEWEAAATWDSVSGEKRTYPWGDAPPTREIANVDQLSFGTAPVGAYPRNLSPLGCYGMIGDVWEWTATDFGGYPGYETFPYREYSEIFFGGEYRVLRGGSWATRPGVARATARNWDYPIRRQIFSGFRCAYDG